ncbi:MAG: DHH family phosphoesterase [Alistipes sp.]|jgi:single-stranded-DNA-specific exonuclease|nr:DHH family phosphoesterase [Alistipes sp.]
MPIEKQWVILEQGDPAKVESLSASLGLSPVLANLLVQRGIETPDQAKEFFDPSLDDLHDPFLMCDMDKAIDRITRAVETGEKVMVWGDYDVDGTSAVALLYSFLRRLGHENLMFYIPDRYTEGYGVSIKGIDYAKAQGVSLIITLDCGIKAVEKVDYATSLGVDFIITDHHLAGAELPRAVAVLDPKRPDCGYPFDELSGCGVGFKIAQAYCQRHGIAFSEVERLLDLVVISIASDIVPVTGENRILAYFGLERLNTKPNKGLASIIKICGLGSGMAANGSGAGGKGGKHGEQHGHRITIDDIVFKIGPRINAAGRMRMGEGDQFSGGHSAVNLMIERDEDAAGLFGAQIDEANSDRKTIDRTVTQEAHDLIESNPEMKRMKSTVIYNPKWMKGIVGIVASRLIETYYRPTVVLTLSNGFATGSARSVPGFDLYGAVESCADILENFGGHMYAAGLTMKPENVAEFTRRFNVYVEENIGDHLLKPTVEIDSQLLFSDITPDFRRDLLRFQPFGPGNTAPVFVTYGASNRGDAKLVGAEHEHLKMDLVQREKPNTSIPAIAFQQPGHFEWIRSGRLVDVCYTVVENHFRGTISPQLRVKDIKPVL